MDMKANKQTSTDENYEANDSGLDNRRDFIKRYGKYAAMTPVAMTTLMSPQAKAISSGIGFPPTKP